MVSFLACKRIHTCGHNRSASDDKNRWVSDRFRSTAATARNPSSATRYPLRSFNLVGGPASREPWSSVCSSRDRAGAHDTLLPFEWQNFCS
jgi:hypothetical protein